MTYAMDSRLMLNCNNRDKMDKECGERAVDISSDDTISTPILWQEIDFRFLDDRVLVGFRFDFKDLDRDRDDTFSIESLCKSIPDSIRKGMKEDINQLRRRIWSNKTG
jgi:hypothetical protein